MLELWQKYNKHINFFGGIFVLFLTLILYFTGGKTEAINSGGKSASEKRMERSISGSNTIQRKSKVEHDTPLFAKKLKSSKQGKNFLLFLMFLGFAMLIYSLYSKYKSQKS